MASKTIIILTFYFYANALSVLLITVNGSLDESYKVENSANETDKGISDLVEQAFQISNTEGGDNLESVTLLMETMATAASTEAIAPNITTKPTWIQRIPKKKKTKSDGE
ncbi:hypothetical protein PGB90_004103 [Kerria lacca]